MATAIFNNGVLQDSRDYAHAADRPGFWSRLFDRMVEGRMVAAQERVNYHLALLDDATLSNLGLDESEIKDVRAGHWAGKVYPS